MSTGMIYDRSNSMASYEDYDKLAFPRKDSSGSYQSDMYPSPLFSNDVYPSSTENTWPNSLPTDQSPLMDLLFPDGIDNSNEKHQLLDEDGSPDSKRQELSGENERKKPGRKPILNEPTTKRKAQNRAAQRAFRERKENHVKILEARVAELEQQNDSQSAENAFLKQQLTKLRRPSQEFNFPDFDSSAFTFAVPPPSMAQHRSLSDGTSSSASPHSNRTHDSGSSIRHQSECPSLSSGNSPLSPPEKDFNAASMPMFSRQFSGPGSQASFKPVASTSANLSGSKSSAQEQSRTEASENALFFDNMLSPSRDLNFGGFNPMDYRDTSTFNNFDIDPPLFDGVEPFTFEPEFPDFTFQAATYAPQVEPNLSTQVQKPGAQAKEGQVKIEENIEVPTDAGNEAQPPENQTGCKEVWRKIVAHPKFDTFDIDELCEKMRNQANCSLRQSKLPEDQQRAWARFDAMLDDYADDKIAKQST